MLGLDGQSGKVYFNLGLMDQLSLSRVGLEDSNGQFPAESANPIIAYAVPTTAVVASDQPVYASASAPPVVEASYY